MRPADRQRQQEERRAALLLADHDHRLDAGQRTDMPHPGGAPAVGLEDRAVALAVELPPDRRNSRRIAMDAQDQPVCPRDCRNLRPCRRSCRPRMHKNVGLNWRGHGKATRRAMLKKSVLWKAHDID